MITINGLTKHYGPLVAVNNATFSVSPGTITGFLGPNGAGKSTTLRLLLGLENPTGGDALIDGQPYRSLARPMTVVGALLDAGWVHPRRSGRNHLRWMAATNGISAARVDGHLHGCQEFPEPRGIPNTVCHYEVSSVVT